MEREDGKIIQLLSKDGALFDFKEGLRDLSKMIGSVVEDGGFDEMIPIPVATKETLNLLKNWCEIHNYEISPVAKPVKSSSLEKNLSHIDFAFFQALSQEETLQLLELAYFIDYKNLLDICCVRIYTDYFMGLGSSFPESTTDASLPDSFIVNRAKIQRNVRRERSKSCYHKTR
eukprot:TRINITY_DN1754_c0_g1_i3.p1 TRINITY_DN1754_c0_g1~~TRINITY_DN1754_c0_g1_i3.p1  ORF type:complete len:174 (-),score=17.41 TRINITY_DN1754_c0_g1_i3:309-830(-)